MRKTIILLLLIIIKWSYSQTPIFGIYEFDARNSINRIQLNLDYTYVLYECRDNKLYTDFKELGTFKIINDTIYLESDSERLNSRFVIMKYNENEFFLDSFKVLVETMKKDSIFENFYLNQLSANNAPYFGDYIKQVKFYNNGETEYKVNSIKSSIIIRHYHDNGKLQSIRSYQNKKRSGTWYYFDLQGELIKIETYKKDKLIKQ